MATLSPTQQEQTGSPSRPNPNSNDIIQPSVVRMSRLELNAQMIDIPLLGSSCLEIDFGSVIRLVARSHVKEVGAGLVSQALVGS